MSTLHRLKAYFGMVPADELDDYDRDDYDADYDTAPPRREVARGRSRWDDGAGRYDDDRAEGAGRGARAERDADFYDEPRRPAPPRRAWAADAPPTRGSLAVDPAREARDVPVRAAAAPADDAHPMSRITTLHPRTYHEARTIGEAYRSGIPVIMNLTAMEDADARRLVDFAAGLAFALCGSIDKVTTKVFLISPADVDVTAEDKRRIAEGSFLPPRFGRS